MNKQNSLIDSLASDLTPVRTVKSIDVMALVWLLLSAAYVVAVTHILGSARENATIQLINEPRFLMETLLGFSAITTTALAAFRAAIPGATRKRLVTLSIVLMVLWIANYVIGLAAPTLEPSMLGKRDHCFTETLLYALPPMFSALYLVRRLYPLRPMRTAIGFSLAAGMLPALYMQIACMYVPNHILMFHIIPGIMVVPIGVLSAYFLLNRHHKKP
ncbi:MAG: NrsF family protein [Halioglobus sp.]